MNRQHVGFGAVALLVLMIVLVVSILGVLSAVTSQADLAAARRQADYVLGNQECANQAQRWLCRLGEGQDALEDALCSQTFTDGQGHYLVVTVERKDGGLEIAEWRGYTQWDGDSQTEKLLRRP